MVKSFTPRGGRVGTSVTITGATSVTFDGVAAIGLQTISDTQIDALVPIGGVTGTITVTTPGGTGTSRSKFTVTTK